MKVLQPVCGCDGKSYDHPSLAKNAGITTWTTGRCEDCIGKKPAKPMDCPENWEPVCGCNNKTYGNKCFAKEAGITTWTKGECPGKGKK